MGKPKTANQLDTFSERLKDIVQANLSDNQFGVESLAHLMSMSRSQLHRKTKRHLNRSVNQFIREVRLNEALKLLKAGSYTAAEVSYQVGFSSPTYFNKCFHEYYGYPPGEVKNLNLEENRDIIIDQGDISSTEESKTKKGPEGKAQKKSKKTTIAIIALILVIFSGGIYFLINFRLLKLKDRVEIIDKSIAVLPFRNDSPEPENDYFCNGMTDEVLTRIQKISGLVVKTGTLFGKVGSADLDIKKIANELKVEYILIGSVRKSVDDVIVTVQLINGNNGEYLWSETYDGKYTEKIFDFQRDIAMMVASALHVEVTPEEAKKIDKSSTTQVMAWDLVSRGAEMIDQYNVTGDHKYFETANYYFNKALDLDPENSKAYWGKGHAHSFVNNVDSAIFYGQKAIALDPEDASAFALVGVQYSKMHNKLDLAIEYLSKAVELAPENGWINLELGYLYFNQFNDPGKGLPYANKAIKLGGREVYGIYNFIGEMFLTMGNYDLAIVYLKQSITLKSNCYFGKFENTNVWKYVLTLIASDNQKEMPYFMDSICSLSDCEILCTKYKFYHQFFSKELVEAEKYFTKYIELGGRPNSLERISYAYILKETGKRQAASDLLNKSEISLKKQVNDNKIWLDYVSLSSIHAIIGEKEKSLNYLSQAVNLGLRWGYHDLIPMDPKFESLWNDPEFKAIIKHARDEKAAQRTQVRAMEKNGEIDL